MGAVASRALRRGSAVEEAREALDEALARAEFVPCRDGALPKTAWDENAEKEIARAASDECLMRCPARDECLFYALVSGEPDGIWGGVPARGRRGLRASRYQ